MNLSRFRGFPDFPLSVMIPEGEMNDYVNDVSGQ